MNILVVSQRFYPENFRINDIVESLVLAGHTVTVLCGLPNYPKGYIFEDYKYGQNRNEIYKGANVIRAKEIGRRNNILFRFLNYYSFPFYANKLVNKLAPNFDVILVNQLSPIMMANPAIKYKNKYKKKIIMYSMDLWPASLLAGGIKEKSLIYKYYTKVSAEIYKKMDSILVSSKGHIDYLNKFTNSKLTYLPQYAEGIFANIEQKHVFNKPFTFVFAGNIGKAQNLSVFLDACKLLNRSLINDFRVLIIGDGSEKMNLQEKANKLDLKNITFIGQVPLSDVIKYYEISDCMIVSLEKNTYATLTLPGKVQTYMAAAKPILSFASGETNNLIKDAGCGLIAESDDPHGLASNILSFIKMNPKDLETFSQNSKAYFENNFKKDFFIKKLIDELEIMSN